MKEQYVGDINDYRKYALLRRLARGGFTRIGVCWMLTPPDGRNDGSLLSYLDKADHRHLDPPLFELLGTVRNAPDLRRLVLIEESGIIPSATYVNRLVPDGFIERQAWFSHVLESLKDTDLVFFDPDNGLNVRSVSKGQVNSSKYLYRDEVRVTYGAGHSILIYQHFPREERGGFVRRIADDLCALAPVSEVWVFRTSHVAFFLVTQPKHRFYLAPEFEASAASEQPPFLQGERICGQVGSSQPI